MADQPPPRMTWSKAAPALTASAIFDALRYGCLFLVFFAPAIAGAVVTAKTGSSFLGGATTLVSGVVEAFAPGAAAGVELIGLILSIAMMVLGIIFLLVFLTLTNPRIFKQNPFHMLWTLEGVLASFVFMTWSLYREQIKKDKEKYAEWERANKARLQKEQAQKLARVRLAQEQVAVAQQAQEAEAAAEEQEAQEAEEAEEEERASESFEQNAFDADQIPDAANENEIPAQASEAA